MVNLNPKQETFSLEYLVDLNATRAAIRAGYSAKTAEQQGSRLLSNVKVKERIQELKAKRADNLGITAEYVLQTIKDTIERCRQARPVTYKDGTPVLVETPDGDIVPAYSFKSADVLKGCELLGKHLGMFKDGQKDDDTPPPPTRVEIVVTDARK